MAKPGHPRVAKVGIIAPFPRRGRYIAGQFPIPHGSNRHGRSDMG